jgi:virginiamycin A acetyltransferase
MFKFLKKYFSKSNSFLKKNIIDRDSSIGAHTYIGFNTYVTKASIGRYCSIANNVSIGPGEHSLEAVSTSALFVDGDVYEKLTEKQCYIGHDVWIGSGAIVRRGVKVGNGAVIGANSFVNSDIPPFAVAVGNPAKIKKYRFSKDLRDKIEKSQWWMYELDEAKNIIKDLL